MNTVLKKDIFDSMEPVWSGNTGSETSEEYIVPDTMPDVGEIIDGEGLVTVRGKETGPGYVQITAGVSVSVLYTPADGGAPRCLEFSLPGNIRLDTPGTDTDCQSTVRVRVRALDARPINSRKISVRVELEAEARCCRRSTWELSSGLETEEAGVHILTRESEGYLLTEMCEKSFVVTDEYPMPPELPEADSLISRRITPMVEDVKYVSGKVVFRGRVRSELTFCASAEGRLLTQRYETEFSQIMEAGDGVGEALPQITLLLTGAYYDLPEYGGDSGRISAELHFSAQCECYARRKMRYIADAYSNRTELIPGREDRTVTGTMGRISLRQSASGQMEPAVTGGELIRTGAYVTGITSDKGVLQATVNVRMLFRLPDGRYMSSRCRLPASFAYADETEADGLEQPEILVTDVYCSGGMEVRASLQLNALTASRETIRCVTELASDDEAWSRRERMPSLVLIKVPEGTELWDIARRYHSTVEAIAAANDGRESGLLMIPKGR